MITDKVKKIKEKIVKLQRKAESAESIGNLDEAEIFITKVQELLQQYNLEMSDIQTEEEQMVNIEREDIDFKSTHGWAKTDSNWLHILYHWVSKYNFCKFVGDGNTKNPGGWIIGEEHNRDMVKFICAQVVPVVKRLRKERWREYQGHEKTNAFKRGYYRGAVAGFRDKMREQEEASKAKFEGMAGLMVLNEKLVDEKTAEYFGRLRKTSQRGLKGQSGRQSGYQDGKKINVKQGVGSGSRPAGNLLN